MRRTNNRESTLLDTSPLPAWIYCPETLTFMYVNEAALKTYGYSKEEFAQMTLKDIRPEEDILPLLDEINNGVRTNITLPQTSRHKHRRKDGSVFYVELFASYVEYNDCPGRLVQAVDIDSKVLEQEQANNAMNTLLRGQKDDLDYLLKSINEVIWIAYAGDFSLLYANDACKKVYGYTAAEMTADKSRFFNSVHPEDLPVFMQSFHKMMQTGYDEREFRIIHKDGSIRHLRGTCILRKGKNGGPDMCCGLTADITELKEEQLRSENILNSITDGFFVLDKEFRFTYINQAYKNMFGGIEEIEGDKTYWELFPNAAEQQFFTEYHRAIKENTAVHFEEYATSLQKWVKVSAYPFGTGLAVYFTDINEEKKLKDAIELQEKNLYALINNTNDLIWSMDRHYNIISVNSACIQYIGKLLNWELKPGGKAAVHGMTGEERKKWTSYYERTFGGESFKVTQLYDLDDGTSTYWEVTFNPIADQHGHIIGASCFATDVTEARSRMILMEMQNARLKEIAQLQSHQVRGPVATIMGLRQLIDTSNPADPVNTEVLNGIQAACETLDNMIRSIDKKTHAAWPEV